MTWDGLVSFVKEFPWHDPDLPDAGDWNGWAGGPDTFQARTWGEVTGLHLDEVLTDDEYFALTDIFDSLAGWEITMVKPGVVPIISNDYDDHDVVHPEALPGTTVPDVEGRTPGTVQ